MNERVLDLLLLNPTYVCYNSMTESLCRRYPYFNQLSKSGLSRSGRLPKKVGSLSHS